MDDPVRSLKFDFVPDLRLGYYGFLSDPKRKDDYTGLEIINREGWDGVKIISYRIQTSTTFLNPNEKGISDEERRRRWLIAEMRGTKFFEDKCICRMLHKFLNLVPDKNVVLNGSDWRYTINDVDWSSVRILEKLDGSLIAAYIHLGKIVFATKKGRMPEMEEFLQKDLLGPAYNALVTKWLEWTCMFEWCSPANKIIIPYDKQSLTLISMRNIRTGFYMPYEKLVEIASAFGIPVVKELVEKVDDVDTFIASILSRTDIEGCVVINNHGTPLFKFKTAKYADTGRLVNYISSVPSYVWEIIFGEESDDKIEALSEPTKGDVTRFQDAVLRRLDELAIELFTQVTKIREELVKIIDDKKQWKRSYFEKSQQLLKSEKKNTRLIALFTASREYKEFDQDKAFEIVQKFCKERVNDVKFLEELFGFSFNDYKSINI